MDDETGAATARHCHPNGLEIAVDGFTHDPGDVKPAQVFLEVQEGMLRIHVWTDQNPNPTVIVDVPPSV